MNDRAEKYVQALKGRQLSRREFMTAMAAVGISSSAASALFATGANAAMTPKRGGHARIGLHQGSVSDSVDTTQNNSGFSYYVYGSVLSHLTEIAPDGQLEPVLAESYEPNANATEWTINLRKGVEFHNGKTLDADDVITTFNLHRGEDSKSPVRSLAEQITKMRKDGAHRVIFTLKDGNADFPFILSSAEFGILPAKDGAVEFGIGTGAYSLERFDPGVSFDFKRNPNYFRSDRGFFDTVSGLAIKDPSSRQNALVTGETDIIGVPGATAALLARKEGVVVFDVTGFKPTPSRCARTWPRSTTTTCASP
jgi:peptide/nickel transport system substrate-binding protein